jgi:hypothetical protein
MIPRPIVKKVYLTKEQSKQKMEKCAICYIPHLLTVTCKLQCGHVFGAQCYNNWTPNTCPLCRSVCREITYYKMPKRRRYYTDEEADLMWKCMMESPLAS